MSLKKTLPFILLCILMVLVSCKSKTGKINPAFQKYIAAFTAGPVSVKDPLRIRLTSEFVNDDQINIPLDVRYFTFKPSIKGKTVWLDRRTLEFRPDKPLPAGKTYNAVFHLSKLLPVPDSLTEFSFSFRTMQQDIEVLVENHKAYTREDLSKEKLYGKIMTADVADDKAIPGILSATQDGHTLNISWIHDSKKNLHYFQVESVRRYDHLSAVKITWNGSAIGAGRKGEQVINIQPLNVFACTGTRIVQGEEKYILVQFSDPLLIEQDLNGLISIGKKNDFRYITEDNELRVYPFELKNKTVTLSVDRAVKNFNGRMLMAAVNERLEFEDTRPAVRFTGPGTIMPVSKQLILPFEAVNLRAVDLKIIKIYENNILQFLQINDLDGQSELARVGKPVLTKTIPLREVSDYSRWNRFFIDLSELIKPEEGALYCIRLSIRKSYSVWTCTGNEHSPENSMVTYGATGDETKNSWYYYGSYEDDYYSEEEEDYDWRQRDNPCKSYYYHNKSVSTNVLVSNFGIIAKDAGQGKIMVVVADLVTAKPVSGVKLNVYNFQQQVIGSGLTDGEGVCMMYTRGNPPVIVAHKEDQSGYLRLQEGKSLSVSMFEVDGDPVQKGLKGFLYGDRGVWRPGDSLYLTFILEDKKQVLPPNHPVTFTLSNPAGQIVNRINRTSSLNGFYSFSTATLPDAPTGNWTAKVKVGEAEFAKTLKIETVKPNRLKINIDFGTDRLMAGKENKVSLSSNWLTGAAAENLKATVNLTLGTAKTSFKKYPGYSFENPSRKYTTEKSTVFEGKLDANGKATFIPKIKMTSAAPGILSATFETTVYEQGGDFSMDKYTLPYYPYTSFVGMNLRGTGRDDNFIYTGKDYRLDLVNVDPDGNPIQNNKLKIELVQLEWRWWWDDSGDNGNSGFVSTEYGRIADSATVMVKGGTASYILRREDDDWGRYFIRVTDKRSGHVCGQQIFADSYGYSHAPDGGKKAATMLSFKSDKEKYKVGEKARITFPSSAGARAFLTIENGTEVLRSVWINTTSTSTEYLLDVTPDMAPNCYASISLIQKHAQTVNDLPIRLYGVIPIMVEDPGTIIHPEIIMPEVLRPEEKVSVTVKEDKGLPMTYTLALVDEGLLDLTRFRTPDPRSVFYAKEALGVKTWDVYDNVLGAWSGELQRILSIGGDKDAVNKGALKANRFKPVVKFFGPFNLARGKSKTHSFTMPQYVGSVRVMVVAGNNGAYGNAEKTVPVRKPLMVLGTLPRMLTPGEVVTLPVTVFAMEKNVKNVSVKISASNLFTIIGNSAGSVAFMKPGEKIVYFRMKVKEEVGIGKVNITAVAGNEKAVTEIELDVRNPNPAVTEVTETTIQPGKEWNGNFLLPGIAGTNSGTIEISSIPPLNLEKRLRYLVTYPYGCTEQIISGAFPQLYLQDLLDLTDVRKKEIESNIRVASVRIRNNQLASGGITLWPGSGNADDWTTSYAGHFLIEAQQKGYTLPSGFLPAWKNFQKQKAITWKANESWYNNDLIQAYRLYTLALAGAPEMGAMNLLMEKPDISVTARWRLAAAYVLAGRPEAALKLTSRASTAIQPYRQMDYSFGSEIRDQAMIIETLLLMNRKNDAAALVKKISIPLSQNEWMSTQTTSFALMAISRFFGGAATAGIDVACRIEGGKEIKASTGKFVVSLPMDLRNKSGKGSVVIRNKGKSLLMVQVFTTGIPAKSDTSSSASALKMEVRYVGSDGKTINPATIQRGTTFYAEVTLINPGLRGNYEQMALTQVLPPGWEIINSRMSDFAAASATASGFDYQDIRDDRVMTFFGLPPGKSKTFRIMLTASYVGRYYLPPVYCEAMYDASIHAKIRGRWVEVTDRER